MKTCTKCQESKPLSEFYRRVDRPAGYQNRCKACWRVDRASYVSKHPDRIKDTQYRMDYGISLVQYNELFLKQSGKCAICKRHASEFKKALAVDHNHETGMVRALLCTNCNTALGKFQESPALLKMAIEYLEQYLTVTVVQGSPSASNRVLLS